MANLKVYRTIDLSSVDLSSCAKIYDETGPLVVALLHSYGLSTNFILTGVAIPVKVASEWSRNAVPDPVASLLHGDDVIELLATGNTVVDAGEGEDLAVFGSSFGSYVIRHSTSETIIFGPEGTTELSNLEHLQFADGSISLSRQLTSLGAGIDGLTYLHQNNDVWSAQIDPEYHYNVYGWREGRDPNAFFSTAGYSAAYGDVANSELSPLAHYNQTGWQEGRDPSANFDTQLYLLHNADVKAAGIDPLVHYLMFGQAEGRQTHAAIGSVIQGGFDAQFYLLSNPDVGNAGVDPYHHYLEFGSREGRDPNAYFDTNEYLSQNPDVAAAGMNPLVHYDLYGWKEDRDPSARFDTETYQAVYTDVAAAQIDPLQHFLQYGALEGRSAFGDGIWS
jgi:hypothetical protein